MHAWVFYLATIWLLGLAVALCGFAFQARTTVHRALALDVLTLVFVAELATLAVWRHVVGFLDVALVLAMLGFVQTVATARLVERREDLQ